MTFNIQDLNKVDDDNQQNWPEGTQKVNEVNNAGRADEGMLARWFADWNGSKITQGTGSAYTVSLDTLPTAYYDGLQLVCEIHADNAADATLNAQSLGAATIKKNGTENLVAGDLKAGMVALFVYRGTDWNLVSAAYLGTAAQKNTGTAADEVPTNADLPTSGETIYTASGTFEKASLPNAVTHITVEVLAGHGGGGGCPNTGSGQTAGGGGGGAGGYSRKRIAVSALAASETVTVGSGGLGGVGGAVGSQGGSSSFGAFLSATGGFGGNFINASASVAYANGGDGGMGSGGDINARGGVGAPGGSSGASQGLGGNGGNSNLFAGGAQGRSTSSAFAGVNGIFGGGSGAVSGANQAAQNGGNGGDGIVIVSW